MSQTDRRPILKLAIAALPLLVPCLACLPCLPCLPCLACLLGLLGLHTLPGLLAWYAWHAWGMSPTCLACLPCANPQRLRAKTPSLENASTNDDTKQTCKGRQQMLSSSRRQRHSRETESRNRINRTLCEQSTWHERLETKRSKTKSLEKRCGRARGPRTEAGAENGERGCTHKMKTEGRQEAGQGRGEVKGQDRSNEEARQEEGRGKITAG